MTDQVLLHPTRSVIMLPDPSDVGRLLTTVPTAKVVEHKGRPIVAAKHNSDTVVALRAAGVDAPSSISTRYNWPGRLTPFDHQYQCAEFHTLSRMNANLSDMATGKTAAALWAADWLMREGLVRKALIVSTLSTLEPVWVREMFAVLPHRTACVLHAERRKRQIMAAERQDDFFIVNHDGVTVIKDILAKRGDIDLIIYDEASALKNGQTNRFKFLRTLVQRCNARLWLLTGTPAAQVATDAWALARLINPFDVNTNPTGAPASFVRFRDKVMSKYGPFRWVEKTNARLVVRQILQPAIRFKKEDCITLPPTVKTDRHASLSPEQQRAFDTMKKDFQTQAVLDSGQGVQVTAINAAVKLSKLLQICSGAAYTEDGRIAVFDMSDRLKVMMELITQASKKVIIFVPFRHAIDRVHAHIVGQNITCGVMHGGIKGEARNTVVRRFMDEKDPYTLVAHPKTASHGLNFTCADTIIWFGPTFSAETYQQANERMARPGQDSHMLIAHLSSSDIERKAFQLLYDRQVGQQSLLSLYEETIGVPKP